MVGISQEYGWMIVVIMFTRCDTKCYVIKRDLLAFLTYIVIW